jgi:hypothetical protein
VKDAVVEKAHALIAGVRSALRDGVRHYNKWGRLLETEKEVLECLVTEGKVQVEPENRE